MFSKNPFKSVRPTQEEATKIKIEDMHRETNAKLQRMAEFNWKPRKKEQDLGEAGYLSFSNPGPLKSKLGMGPNDHKDEHIKQAMAIAKEMGGNMTGATRKIDKIAPNLSGHPKVSDALRLHNEGVQQMAPIKPTVRKAEKVEGIQKTHHLDDHDNTDTDFVKLAKKHNVKHKATSDGTMLSGHPDNIKKILGVMPSRSASEFKEAKKELDPVGKEDDDIDNDGDVDKSDKHLHKRRKKIKKAIKKQEEEEVVMNPKLDGSKDQQEGMTYSKIRSALLDTLNEKKKKDKDEKKGKGEHYKSAADAEDANVVASKQGSSKGANDMRDDHYKAPEDADVDAKKTFDADAKTMTANAKVAKPRNPADKTRSGDQKIIPSATPVKDPAAVKEAIARERDRAREHMAMAGVGVRSDAGPQQPASKQPGAPAQPKPELPGSASMKNVGDTYHGRAYNAMRDHQKAIKMHSKLDDHMHHADAAGAHDHAAELLHKMGPDHPQYMNAAAHAKAASADANETSISQHVHGESTESQVQVITEELDETWKKGNVTTNLINAYQKMNEKKREEEENETT